MEEIILNFELHIHLILHDLCPPGWISKSVDRSTDWVEFSFRSRC